MASRIEDYAIIGDTQTAALVGKDGSIDWLCVPRFDSGAVFAALLGTQDHGRWKLAPAGGIRRIERRYKGDTLVLETTFHTDDGVVRVIDCMPIRGKTVDIVRLVEGVSGRVPIHMDLRMRFDYGANLPWVTDLDGRLHATAGPDSMVPHHSGADRGRRPLDGLRLRRRGRRRRPVHLGVAPVARAPAAGARRDRTRCAARRRGGGSGRSSARTRASRATW